MSVTYYHTKKGSFLVYPTHIEKLDVKSSKWEKFNGNHFDILDHRPFGDALEKASAFVKRVPVSSLAVRPLPMGALTPFKAAMPPMVIKPLATFPAVSFFRGIASLARMIK